MDTKIAVSSAGKSVESRVSAVFGRCPYFLIIKIEDGKIKEIEIVDNKSKDQMSRAGVSGGQLVAEKGVKAVITGNIGPRALDVFDQFDIEVFLGEGKIKNVVKEFLKGKLKGGRDKSSCEECPYKGK
jgi:predicted Fe-Mo cluster-binding NifX family protein